ncbi:MAG: OmpH family outer membrane protein [Deltaproteobacteria bacterium]|jgi:outer membrane protein|nr:OmpH family outer membrane protein [Deltaproteobacteria bacterium]
MFILTKLLSWPTLFAALFLALVVFSSPALAQNIGVVDLQKAVDDSKAGKTAKNKLKAKHESLQKSLEAKEKELEKKDRDLKNQVATLNQEALEKRRGEFLKEIQTYRDQAQKASEEMQKALNDALSPIYSKAEQAAAKLASERGFTAVLDAKEGGVIFFQSSIDITPEITKALDK